MAHFEITSIDKENNKLYVIQFGQSGGVVAQNWYDTSSVIRTIALKDNIIIDNIINIDRQYIYVALQEDAFDTYSDREFNEYGDIIDNRYIAEIDSKLNKLANKITELANEKQEMQLKLDELNLKIMKLTARINEAIKYLQTNQLDKTTYQNINSDISKLEKKLKSAQAKRNKYEFRLPSVDVKLIELNTEYAKLANSKKPVESRKVLIGNGYGEVHKISYNHILEDKLKYRLRHRYNIK